MTESDSMKNMLLWLDILLNALSDSTLREVDNTIVWKTLHLYAKTLFSFFEKVTCLSAPLWSKSKIDLADSLEIRTGAIQSWIQLRLEYQGLKEYLMGLLKRRQDDAPRFKQTDFISDELCYFRYTEAHEDERYMLVVQGRCQLLYEPKERQGYYLFFTHLDPYTP
ncbi:hypothetical protein FBU30_006189 [Linnemannia zychae]|nr:hypothetical protein FBU30_006189 [Linnemannia zychae]